MAPEESKSKEINLSIDYRELEDWLGCPECGSPEAKIEKGSLQLFCPNCKERKNLVRNQ